jgi:hypothetical protein
MIQALELHVVTVCVVLLAIEPLRTLGVLFYNWRQRRLNARAKKMGITR